MQAHISAGNMNERGRERTAAGLRTVGRRWAGGGGRGRGEGSCLLTLARILKERWGRRGGGGGGKHRKLELRDENQKSTILHIRGLLWAFKNGIIHVCSYSQSLDQFVSL